MEQKCKGKKKVIQTVDGLKWKCLKCKEEWNIDPRNLKVARLQLDRS